MSTLKPSLTLADMQTQTNSNLSKIKPKLRTQGRVSGNFGRNKVQAGSKIADLGVTRVETIHVTSREKYIERMLQVFYNPPNEKMRKFAFNELHKMHYFKERRLDAPERTSDPYRTPGAG